MPKIWRYQRNYKQNYDTKTAPQRYYDSKSSCLQEAFFFFLSSKKHSSTSPWYYIHNLGLGIKKCFADKKAERKAL